MNCPVCKGDVFVLYREVHSSMKDVPEGLDRGGFVHVRIERCAKCALYRTVHLSEQRSADELYAGASLSHEASATKVRTAGTRPISTVDELKLLSVLPPARLLDVGCGAGQFLLRAQAAGYSAEGIDPDHKSVAFVRETLNIPARAGSFEVLDARDRFDVIGMLGVLEHVEDPVGFLEAARDRLSARGELLVGVPNVHSLNRRISRLSKHDWDMFLEPGHLYHYGAETLRRLGHEAGFELLHWQTATITIRGKLPLVPVRVPKVESAVRFLVSKNSIARSGYVRALRSLDHFHAGDMLLAVMRRGGQSAD